MSWRNDLVVRSGVVGFGFGFVAPCPGLLAWIASVAWGEAEAEGRTGGEGRSVPFRSRLTRNAAGQAEARRRRTHAT
jgi:hypothetical protein